MLALRSGLAFDVGDCVREVFFGVNQFGIAAFGEPVAAARFVGDGRREAGGVGEAAGAPSFELIADLGGGTISRDDDVNVVSKHSNGVETDERFSRARIRGSYGVPPGWRTRCRTPASFL